MKRAALQRGFTVLELIVVIGIFAVLVALLVPAVQRAREVASRLRCQNNLRQIGLALHQYNDTQGSLPSGIRGASSPTPYMSWLTQILPFVEQEALWNQAVDAYAVDANYQDAPPHPFATPVALYGCSSDPRSSRSGIAYGPWGARLRVAYTSYVGVEGRDQVRKDGCLFLDSHIRLTDVSDGLSNTLLVGERPPSANGWFGWWYAGMGQAPPPGSNGQVSGDGSMAVVLGVRERPGYMAAYCPGRAAFGPGKIDNQCDMLHFWSPHLGDGANFVFADGSVHFVHYPAAPLMPALATRSGGEAVSSPD